MVSIPIEIGSLSKEVYFVQLVINTPGSYLRKKEGNFLVKTDEQVFEVSAKNVQSIMTITGMNVSDLKKGG